MLEDHAKLLTLFSHAGEVVGRKKLQKILYILKKMDYPFQQKYQFHFYGPYSEELTLQIEELGNLGFVQETREEKGGYHQYRYVLTESGEEFLGHYDIELPDIQTLIHQLNGQNSRFLELISTMLFFDELDEASLVNKVQVVKKKQNYTMEEIQSGLDYLKQLKSH
ncbi:YwgA family protein [Tuberibacillus sp. Marseille-P3662]|uniref:YwgA family protein n=1 Tax=Tuberibacillus sp. Marseille-P3662 TaxID=1965358 RepID=UPI000A1C96A9|nr:hypothetical protein [Tuberibacillus sp. Marseille-P3662]